MREQGSNNLCRCCNGKVSVFVDSTVYGFSATYVKCDECFSVQIVNPHWLVEAHSKAISKLDTGLVARCLSVSSSSPMGGGIGAMH